MAQIVDTSLCSMIRTAVQLTSLELRGFDLTDTSPDNAHFSALAGAPIRHMALHVTRFADSVRRGMEEALTSMLANLPQLTSLDMSFPRCDARGVVSELEGMAQRVTLLRGGFWGASSFCTVSQSSG